MSRLRLAVASGCFELPLRDLLRAAAASGAAGVQFDARRDLRPGELSETGRRQFLQNMDELGLRVASLAFPTRRTFYDPDALDRRVAGAKAAMEFAWQVQARVVTSRVGRIPADTDSRDYQTLCEVLRDLATYGNRIGATFAITPTHESPEQLAALLACIDTGPLGVNFDPAAFVLAGHHPAEAFRVLYGNVSHFQARDAVRDIDGGGREVAVGRGDVEWDELLALLDESQYGGWITADRTSGEDRAGDVAKAVRYLQTVAAGA